MRLSIGVTALACVVLFATGFVGGEKGAVVTSKVPCGSGRKTARIVTYFTGDGFAYLIKGTDCAKDHWTFKSVAVVEHLKQDFDEPYDLKVDGPGDSWIKIQLDSARGLTKWWGKLRGGGYYWIP